MLSSNKLFLAAACAMLAGCSTSEQRVFVDLSAVPLAEPQGLPDAALPPQPPEPAKGATVTLPPLPGTELTLGARDELLRENIEQAERELTRALTRQYLDEAERQAASIIGALAPEREKDLAQAQAQIREIFQEYAEQRGPLVMRLTTIVGFPDPNPNSIEPKGDIPPVARQAFEQARELRQQIRALDEEYEAEVQQLLTDAQAVHDLRMAEARAEIARQRAAAMDRAEAEAVKQALDSYKALEDSLLTRQTIQLPGASSRSVSIEPMPEIAVPPPVEPRILTRQEQLELLESQVQIWAATRSYKLSDSPLGARNMTDEFIRWREEMGL